MGARFAGAKMDHRPSGTFAVRTGQDGPQLPNFRSPRESGLVGVVLAIGISSESLRAPGADALQTSPAAADCLWPLRARD
jgi:hypothetical protein